jgi:phosphonate transport system permease protein
VGIRAAKREPAGRAGGIGQVFFEAFRGFDYHATAAILIIIIVTVSVLDIASQRVRKLFS